MVYERGVPLPDVRDETALHLRHIGVIAFELFLQQLFLPHRPSREHALDEESQEHSDPRSQQ